MLCLFIWLQDLKGKILIKGKRLNKLNDAFNNASKSSTTEDDVVSEEDEAGDAQKEMGQKPKSKVH